MLTALALIAVGCAIISETASFVDPDYRRNIQQRPVYVKALGLITGIVFYAILAIILL